MCVCTLPMNFINNHKDTTGLHSDYKRANTFQHAYCLACYQNSKALRRKGNETQEDLAGTSGQKHQPLD